MNYNLALIVHRLLTHPRGWPIEDLKNHLAIADRTYRKYRRILCDEFQPFQSRRGESLIREVEVGPVKYLRLVGLREAGISDPHFEARLAAAFLAREWFSELLPTRIGVAFDDLLAEFSATLRDRSFVESTVLSAMRSRIDVTPVCFGDGIGAHLGELSSAIIRNHPVEIELRGGAQMRGCVESLRIEPERLRVQLRGHEMVDSTDIVSVKQCPRCEA